MRLHPEWIVQRQQRLPQLIPQIIQKPEIKNKMCILIQSRETYEFVNFIVKEKADFTRDVELVYCGNDNILTILERYFNNGYRFFLTDHDDDDLIKINTFKYINQILCFNSTSTQDVNELSNNIVRSSTPDYNYVYFIIINLLYTPREALALLSLTNRYVDISKLRRNAPVLVDVLVYIYVENDFFSEKILNYIVSFNELMENIIEIKPYAISLTDSIISSELSNILSSNNISNSNYKPTLFYVNASNNIEADKLLNLLSSEPSFSDNYILFNDTFLNSEFYAYFKYCFIVSRNFSQEGYRFAQSYNTNLTPFNFAIYDFLLYLIPSISNNTTSSNIFFKKLIDNNTIISNSVNSNDIMSYFNRKQTYIYTIDSKFNKLPISYRFKYNPLTSGEINTTKPSYDKTLYTTSNKTNNIIILFNCSDGGGMLIVTKQLNNYICFASNNNGISWNMILTTTNPILDCVVYDYKTTDNIVFYSYIIASNTDIYTMLMVKNAIYTNSQLSNMLTTWNIYLNIINVINNSAFTISTITKISLSNLVFTNSCLITINNLFTVNVDIIIQYKLLRCALYYIFLNSNPLNTFQVSSQYKNIYNYNGLYNSYDFSQLNIAAVYSTGNNNLKLTISTIYNTQLQYLSVTNIANILFLTLEYNSSTIFGKYIYLINTPNIRITNVNIFKQNNKLMMYYCVQNKLYLTDYTAFSNFIITKINELSVNNFLTAFPTITSIPLLPNDILIYTFPYVIHDLKSDSDGIHICITTDQLISYYSNDYGKLFSLMQVGSTVNYTVTNLGNTFLCSNKTLKTTIY